MDWNTIILAIIGVVFSWETYSNVKYRRENKKLKEDEVKKSDVDTQKAQIELGDLFVEKSKAMFEQMQELQEKTLLATQKNGIDNESIIKKMDTIEAEQKRQSAELKRIADEQANIVTFVNGEYQDFLAKNGFKKKKNG